MEGRGAGIFLCILWHAMSSPKGNAPLLCHMYRRAFTRSTWCWHAYGIWRAFSQLLIFPSDYGNLRWLQASLLRDSMKLRLRNTTSASITLSAGDKCLCRQINRCSGKHPDWKAGWKRPCLSTTRWHAAGDFTIYMRGCIYSILWRHCSHTTRLCWKGLRSRTAYPTPCVEIQIFVAWSAQRE